MHSKLTQADWLKSGFANNIHCISSSNQSTSTDVVNVSIHVIVVLSICWAVGRPLPGCPRGRVVQWLIATSLSAVQKSLNTTSSGVLKPADRCFVRLGMTAVDCSGTGTINWTVHFEL